MLRGDSSEEFSASGTVSGRMPLVDGLQVKELLVSPYLL